MACIGIIMDGNRRWAKQQNVSIVDGHRQGICNIVDIVDAAQDYGVQHLVVYAFSTENWSRDDAEVKDIMMLFKTIVPDVAKNLKSHNVRLRFAGQLDKFDKDIQQFIQDMQSTAVTNPAMTVWICLSYGGRAEIAAAADRVRHWPITAESISQALWTADMPPVDLIIRTGGEHRLSGFLTWQSIYSELFFVDEYWPAFTPEHLKRVLDDYHRRNRRYGK